MQLLRDLFGDALIVIGLAILGIVGIIWFLAWLMKKAIDQNK